jgi:hypothetical protein
MTNLTPLLEKLREALDLADAIRYGVESCAENEIDDRKPWLADTNPRGVHGHLLSIMRTDERDYEGIGKGAADRENVDGAGKWGADCSSGCRWYFPLAGRWGGDWGACANPASHRCGLLTFEHQGCAQYESQPTLDEMTNEPLGEPERVPTGAPIGAWTLAPPPDCERPPRNADGSVVPIPPPCEGPPHDNGRCVIIPKPEDGR